MSRYHSYIASAVKAIESYTAGKPLNLHLKAFFAADKKYGSGDRRAISELAYGYFRTGKAFARLSTEDKILLGIFLSRHSESPVLRLFRPELNESIHLPLEAKLRLAEINEQNIFPFFDELGGNIDPQAFARSLFVQPEVYLRVRPGKKQIVATRLEAHNIEHRWIDDAVAFPAKVDIGKVLRLNEDAVVQDLNSQKVLDYLDKLGVRSPSMQAWDCCAASGGKSILLYDKLKGKVNLTVSDIRGLILENLKVRLRQARVPISRSFVSDLSGADLPFGEKFSMIICDAPCTGSGTWSRTPEQLRFFTTNKIDEYAGRQQQIISATIPHLKKEGLYFYITCSVFKKENEEVITLTQEKHNMKILHMEYFEGYNKKADTMFVAVLQPVA